MEEKTWCQKSDQAIHTTSTDIFFFDYNPWYKEKDTYRGKSYSIPHYAEELCRAGKTFSLQDVSKRIHVQTKKKDDKE